MGRDLTEAERIEQIEKESRAFECPHCNKQFQFMVSVGIMGIRKTMTAEEFVEREKVAKSVAPKDSLTPAERQIVEEAKEGGVFRAFEEAVRARPMAVPSNLDKFFITFLKTAAKMKAPQFAIRMCLPEEDGGELELWQFQSVAVVVRDGEFRCFLPKHLIDGKKADFLAVSDGKLRAEQSNMTLTRWIKTRNGYVLGRGLLFDELKGRAAGDFAKATGNY